MTSLNGAPNGAPVGPQLAVRLHTRHKRHEIPDSKFFVPGEWKRFQLSQLINKVLEYEKPVPFDFIAEGELLRTSLSAYITSKGLTEETILELEYVESILPPEYVAAFEQDDWVSDVDLCRPNLFLSACYDGTVKVFNTSGQTQARFPKLSQPILSTCWLGGASNTGEDYVASGGMDRLVRISQLSPMGDGDSEHSVKAAYTLPLHTQPVASVRSSTAASTTPRLLSSGWDGMIGFWMVEDSQQGSGGGGGDEGLSNGTRKKRRKLNPDGGEVLSLAPAHVLRGHAGQVSRAIFDRTEASKAYSCGWDRSVRTWDLETGGQSSARTAADKVLLDIDQMASANLLVTGSTDRTVCFWDTRQDSSTIALTLLGHSGPVSCTRAHPTSAVLALSAGYDGMTRIWDARSSKQALFAVRRKGQTDAGSLDNKILCADWNGDGSVFATGGQDGRLELHRSSVRLAAEP